MMLPISLSHTFIQCLRDSAPADVATLEYNKKISFVGNLINRTGNRIPDTRAVGVRMQQAIAKLLTATPSDIKTNLEQFRRSIQQWAQGLQGPKTLTEGSHISLKAHFQDYMIYGMNNQIITDIKQVGQRVIEFGTKREEPVLPTPG